MSTERRVHAAASMLLSLAALVPLQARAEAPAAAESGTAARQVEIERARAALASAKAELERAARELEQVYEGADFDGHFDFDFERLQPRALLGVIVDSFAGPDGRRRVRVLAVSPGSGAETAGVKAGDLLLALGGDSLVADADEDRPERRLRERMKAFEPGDRVELQIERDGERRSLRVETTSPPRIAWTQGMPGLPALPPMEADGPFGQRLRRELIVGRLPPLQLASMDADLSAYFRTRDGVLVVSVPSDETLQLKSGDVIRKIDGRRVDNPRDALEQLALATVGETVQLEVVRHGKTIKLEAMMPEVVGLADALPRLHVLPAPPAPPPAPPTEPEQSRSP